MKIKKKYGFEVKYNKLRSFYIRNGVKQIAAYGKLYPKSKDPNLLEVERIEFAMHLTNCIVEERPVIYFDETTFNGDMHQKKAWYFKGNRFQIPIVK